MAGKRGRAAPLLAAVDRERLEHLAGSRTATVAAADTVPLC